MKSDFVILGWLIIGIVVVIWDKFTVINIDKITSAIAISEQKSFASLSVKTKVVALLNTKIRVHGDSVHIVCSTGGIAITVWSNKGGRLFL
jgi:hypothetical protein|tara:strand:- start:60 stop:332 length:273 start_codon:yes stop_codon:yes gene_type:complete